SLSIGDNPKAFPVVKDLIDMGIRRRVYQNYSIFFYIGLEFVFIARILNSSMDYSALFES
ncbi:type II toxin-antitoxin system RelE/ParE family toxin, partial [Acinetobacter nectaris]